MNMWLVLSSNNFTLSLWHTNEHDMAWCLSWEIFLNMELTFYCLWRWRRSGNQAPLLTLLTKPSSRYTVVGMYAGLYWPWWTHNEYALIIYLEATIDCLYSICGNNGEKMEGRCLRAWTKFTKKKHTTDQKLNDVYCLNKMLKIFNFPWNEEDTHFQSSTLYCDIACTPKE